MEEVGEHRSIVVQNPLLFDHIIQRIISFVDVEFLPSCRLVSRQWENFALPKLLQNLHKFPVVITGQESASSDPKLERYLSYVAEEGPRLIFKNLALENISFSKPLVDKFMSTCAAEIEDLRLKCHEYLSPILLLEMLDSLVNLKTLTLDVDSTCCIPHDPEVEEPQRNYPKSNIKRLCVNYNGPNPVSVYVKLIAVIIACESLEELSLGGGMPWWHLQGFYIKALTADFSVLLEISVGEMDSNSLEFLMDQQQQNLKLKVLKCQSLVLWDGENRFSKVLEKHKNTLESVVVGDVQIRSQEFVDNSGTYGITFPDVMPKLKVFQLGLPLPSLGTGRIRFSPVNFPVQLPTLEKLFLYYGSTEKSQRKDLEEWEYLSAFFEGSAPHSKLSELCLPFASPKLRKSVGAVFPEISSLKMETELDESAHEIWTMWPQLKSLNLTLNGDRKTMENRVDNFITGMENEGTQGSSKYVDSDSTRLSITNLEDLRQFKLRMIGDCGGSLSDFSVSQAFCKLPCLEFLLLSHHNITDEGTGELLKYHPLLKKVDCPDHPEVFKIQREYLPNDFIPSGFSTEHSVAGCAHFQNNFCARLTKLFTSLFGQ